MNKETKFSQSDLVFKTKGYPFPGMIISVFTTKAGEIRYVVEHDCGGLLHIFNEAQLELKN